MARNTILTLRHQSPQGVAVVALIVMSLVVQTRSNPTHFSAQRRAVQTATTADAAPTLARRPEAMAISRDMQTMWVVCRNGSISCLDLTGNRQVESWQVGGRLIDVTIDQSDQLVVLDQAANSLRIFDVLERHQPMLVESIELASPSSNLHLLEDNVVAVLSQWERDVTLIRRTKSSQDSESSEGTTESDSIFLGTVSIPFAPGQLIALEDSDEILVSDAFGGRLALIDRQTLTTRWVDDTLGHNIRGMSRSTDGQQVLVAQQILNQTAPITPNGIEFGDVLKHVVRTIDLNSIQNNDDHWARHAEIFELGFAGLAATDPEHLVVLKDDRWLIPLGGVNQLAIVDASILRETRVEVGRRPIQVIVDDSQRYAYVLCQFSEVVEVIDIDAAERLEPIHLGPLGDRTIAERGEELFFDATLSRDHWLSCHSCHTDGHTNSLLADTMGDGTHGTPKRVLSLRGVSQTGPWAWNGSVDELAKQVSKSVTSTMHGNELDVNSNQAIAEFLKTLSAPPPAFHTEEAQWQNSIARGELLFEDLGCAECHSPEMSFTTPGRFDVGIHDESGSTDFNPPSLRGVGHRRLLFHDGRASSIKEALDELQHQVSRDLTEKELEDLIAYVQTR